MQELGSNEEIRQCLKQFINDNANADVVVEWARKNELSLSGTILETGEWNFTISWE